MTIPTVTPPETPCALSIVIPAFNEERRLPPTLIDMIDFFDGRGDDYQIIVVNDGSTDATSAVVAKIQRLCPRVSVLEQERNMGKGAAVRRGALAARGQQVLMADADGSTPIQEILRLEQALANGADVAIGSRALTSDETSVETSIHRKVMGRIFNFFVNILLLPGVADTQCGFKLFTREAARFLFERIKNERFSFDVELLYIARRAGIEVAEVPVNWQNVPQSKINLLHDSLAMFLDLARFKIRHRDVAPELWKGRAAAAGELSEP